MNYHGVRLDPLTNRALYHRKSKQLLSPKGRKSRRRVQALSAQPLTVQPLTVSSKAVSSKAVSSKAVSSKAVPSKRVTYPIKKRARIQGLKRKTKTHLKLLFRTFNTRRAGLTSDDVFLEHKEAFLDLDEMAQSKKGPIPIPNRLLDGVDPLKRNTVKEGFQSWIEKGIKRLKILDLSESNSPRLLPDIQIYSPSNRRHTFPKVAVSTTPPRETFPPIVSSNVSVNGHSNDTNIEPLPQISGPEVNDSVTDEQIKKELAPNPVQTVMPERQLDVTQQLLPTMTDPMKKTFVHSKRGKGGGGVDIFNRFVLKRPGDRSSLREKIGAVILKEAGLKTPDAHLYVYNHNTLDTGIGLQQSKVEGVDLTDLLRMKHSPERRTSFLNGLAAYSRTLGKALVMDFLTENDDRLYDFNFGNLMVQWKTEDENLFFNNDFHLVDNCICYNLLSTEMKRGAGKFGFSYSVVTEHAKQRQIDRFVSQFSTSEARDKAVASFIEQLQDEFKTYYEKTLSHSDKQILQEQLQSEDFKNGLRLGMEDAIFHLLSFCQGNQECTHYNALLLNLGSRDDYQTEKIALKKRLKKELETEYPIISPNYFSARMAAFKQAFPRRLQVMLQAHIKVDFSQKWQQHLFQYTFDDCLSDTDRHHIQDAMNRFDDKVTQLAMAFEGNITPPLPTVQSKRELVKEQPIQDAKARHMNELVLGGTDGMRLSCQEVCMEPTLPGQEQFARLEEVLSQKDLDNKALKEARQATYKVLRKDLNKVL